MICISIAQESRRLALADMLNASKQCDLLEVRLDRFGKAPDIGELLTHKPKPIIFSCRRKKDGGDWPGTEEERLTLLRQCVVSKSDYVEIELDVADQIRKFGTTKRVITHIDLQETPPDIAEIYGEAQTKSPDVIKIITQARTPEEAWPLLKILANPPVPTVAVGLGKPAIMLTILGKRIGSPWTYAALERGMEAYPGQPTVRELQDTYHYSSIGPSTRFVGVTGFGERERVSTAVMNHVFASSNLPLRCLPLGVGNVELLRKIMNAVHLRALVVDDEHQGQMMKMTASNDPSALASQAADLLTPTKEKEWHGANTLGDAAVTALVTTLKSDPSANPLEGRMIMIVGTNPTARAVAWRVKEAGGVIIVASHNRDEALRLAQVLECRHVQFEALYSTMHDVLIVCDEEKDQTRSKRGSGEAGLHPGYLRPGMTVMDLATRTGKSTLLQDAAARGCRVVEPVAVLQGQLLAQLKSVTGNDVPRALVQEKLTSMLAEAQ